MNYSDLLNDNKIKPGSFSGNQVKECLGIAKRDIDAARKNINISLDWAFNISYNAMLQSCKALMLSKGYRTVGHGHHATSIRFVSITLGEDFSSSLSFFEMMRKKRNRSTYDMAGTISQKEAEEAIKTIEKFVEDISNMLNK